MPDGSSYARELETSWPANPASRAAHDQAWKLLRLTLKRKDVRPRHRHRDLNPVLQAEPVQPVSLHLCQGQGRIALVRLTVEVQHEGTRRSIEDRPESHHQVDDPRLRESAAQSQYAFSISNRSQSGVAGGKSHQPRAV